jgi:diguanylate cyclase (GGDEF)-like protein
MSATAKAISNDRTPRSRDQGRVLIVTDEPSSIVYRAALERAGFAVVGVTGSVAALVALRRLRPHVIVADVNLQGVGADELARTLSRTEDNVPLVIVGEPEATFERRHAALAVNAFDYFQVPLELQLLLARVAQLIQIRQKIERLHAMADRDYLTGLANRRHFRTALGHEVERWRRYGVPCGLVLLDIDFLKRINDAHGHSAGDVAIRRVASALAELSRDNDTAARLGGEEFALLLAGADHEKALAAAERLRHAVSADPLESIGVVTISDAALYKAKREGRDRTAVAPCL